MRTTDPLIGAKVLVAVENLALASFLADNLTADGATVVKAKDLPFAMAVLNGGGVDGVIVDLNGSTFDAVDKIRNDGGLVGRVSPDVPVMVLTSKYDDQLHRQRTYERGADDVMAKPFSYIELRIRLANLLRRPPSRPVRAASLVINDVVINPDSHSVTVGGVEIHATRYEYGLLVALAAEPTRVKTKEELMHAVWGRRLATRTLDSHVCRLRSKLGAGYLINVWGVGYRLVDALSASDPGADSASAPAETVDAVLEPVTA